MGGGCRTVPFLKVVRCGRFLGDRARANKFTVFAFPSFCGRYYPAILTGALLLLRKFFFSETKIPISAAGFWSNSTGKMVNSPPPAAGLHRPGYSSNVLDLARRAMPYSLLNDFFPPLPDHSPHPQDVGATHRRVNRIYPHSTPPSIKCPALMTLLQGMGRRRT
jgi:hypothetical protein